MLISDLIAQYIVKAVTEENGSALLSRSELAERFRCVPSQINYVLTTRFTPEHGYSVESRRGGGGYIRVSRIRMTRDCLIMHVVNTIGEELDAASATAILTNMHQAGVIADDEYRLLSVVLSEQALSAADRNLRDVLRASILKRCLIQLS